MGKLVTEQLNRLLRCIRKDARVIVPPLAGFDSGVHLIDDKYVVVSTDPCIGVPRQWFGWLLIHYAASDVALFGAKPEFCTINLLGPPSTKPQVFQKIMNQACSAADELNLAIVTGHTGTYDGLTTLVGVCTAYGLVSKDKLITPGGAKPGDRILCTKPVGLEAATNFALMHETQAERLLGAKRAKKLTTLVSMQSCVKEALLLGGMDGVHAMHDATEGGLTEALNELAEASQVGFEVEYEKVPVPTEVLTLQRHFRLSDEEVLSMSSTGTVLVAVSAEATDTVQKALKQHKIPVTALGVFTTEKRRILVKNGKEKAFPKLAHDPYGRILSGRL